MRSFVVASVSCALWAACGADKPSSTGLDSNAPTGDKAAVGKVLGSVEGHSLNVQSASFEVLSSGGTESVVVVLSDDPNYCASISKNEKRENQSKILLLAYVATADNSSRPVTAGSYTILDGNGDGPTQPGSYAIAEFGVQGVDCTPLLTDPGQGFAKSGTVAIQSISASVLDAAITMVVEGNTLSATIHATACPGLATVDGNNIVCTQE